MGDTTTDRAIDLMADASADPTGGSRSVQEAGAAVEPLDRDPIDREPIEHQSIDHESIDHEPIGIDDDAVAAFRAQGWALIRTLDAEATAQLQGWIDEVAFWPDGAGEWMHHSEMTDHGAALCRTENLVPFHGGLRALLTEGTMVTTAGALLGQTAVLYKEKVNYKHPGGAGYAPHQDAPAYPFIDQHVSCLVAVDDATEENGALEVVTGAHHSLLPTDTSGCLRPDVVAALEWEVVAVPAGHTLWFGSRTPHRSGPNRTDRARRALYPTYNALGEGDLRGAYYREKRARFAAGRQGTAEGRVQVSLIGDFQGREV